MQAIRLACAQPSPTMQRIIEVFARAVRERCGVDVHTGEPDAGAIGVERDPSIGPEGFEIADDSAGRLVLRCADDRGLLYGLGKLLRTSRYAPGEFHPGPWRGRSVPERPVRGIYFATHFHNYYHEAPLDEVRRYVEELALWGTNVVSVWFDMHHFRGMADPAAQEMIRRLKGILRAATDLGLGASLTFLANEAYADGPAELRADWTAGHDGYHHEPLGHYHVELCPNQPGARDLLLRWAEEKLEAFADVAIEYLWIWPYDQGGCTCARCRPWGTNGFLTMAEPTARAFRRRFPQGKVILSTWYFDHFTDGEWEGLDRAFATRPDWVDYLLVDDNADEFPAYPLQHGAPGRLPMVSFPEISMYRAAPWGGFGANPLPAHLQELWNQAGQRLAGGFPYSEGIYEDLNKAICAQFYWQGGKRAWDTVAEYIAYEFSPQVVEAVMNAIAILERNLPRRRNDQGAPGDGGATGAGARFLLERNSETDEALRLLDWADAHLDGRARRSWRWRVLYLRGLIDHELVCHEGAISPRCEEAMRELTVIYHAAAAASWVAPPTGEAVWANRQA